MSFQAITHLIAAAIAAAAVWFFQDARWSADVSELRMTQSDAQFKAISKVRADERAIASRYQGALNAARVRESLLRTEIDHLHAVSDGLREQASDAARRLASATPGAVLDYAIALNSVYDDCRAAYGDMAEKAAGHALDVRTLSDAWPANSRPE